MRFHVAITLLIACAACTRGNESPQGGAPPPVEIPVGPVPGPGAKATLAVNPYSGDPVALETGYQLFRRYNCSGCHGDHGGGGMGPSLRDLDWIYGNADAEIFDSIAEGRAHGMPSWGVKIPEEQIWQLVTYIKTFRTEAEPHPPTPIPAPPQE